MNGHNCDNCDKTLADSEFKGYGSWSYTCTRCGFSYNHSSRLTVQEQVDNFNDKQDELEDMYDEDIDEDDEEEYQS